MVIWLDLVKIRLSERPNRGRFLTKNTLKTARFYTSFEWFLGLGL